MLAATCISPCRRGFSHCRAVFPSVSRLTVNLNHFVLFWASYLFSSLCFSTAGMRTAVNGHVTISMFSEGSAHGLVTAQIRLLLLWRKKNDNFINFLSVFKLYFQWHFASSVYEFYPSFLNFIKIYSKGL